MPIPTDTYWNIKKLNVVFAVSALILLGVTGLAILQDFNQGWREPQRHGKVWQSAFVDEKIVRDTTPEKEAQLADLKKRQAELTKQLGPDTPETQQRTKHINDLVSQQANMEFALNTLKANVGVMESNLQDAVTAGDTARIRELTQKIAAPRKQLEQDAEALAAKKEEVAAARKELDDQTAPLAAGSNEIPQLQTDVDALDT